MVKYILQVMHLGHAACIVDSSCDTELDRKMMHETLMGLGIKYGVPFVPKPSQVQTFVYDGSHLYYDGSHLYVMGLICIYDGSHLYLMALIYI